VHADPMLVGMENVCEGCGERARRLIYPAAGPWAGRWFCRDCARGRKKITRLSLIVAFRSRVAKILPPGDPMTPPTLRLMMAVDDVRRAHLNFVEAIERLADPAEAYRVIGDFLYAVRLLFSHVHEAGHALRQLDGVARDANGENRVNALLKGEDHREGMAALTKLRKFFSAQGYWGSLIYRVRNMIGSHYDEDTVTALVSEEFTGDATLESTAATVGGLARMADAVVRTIINRLNGGDFMADATQTQKVQEALAISGLLIDFVDHLFAALVEAHPDAVEERHVSAVKVPPLVARASEAVDAARARLRAEPVGDQGP